MVLANAQAIRFLRGLDQLSGGQGYGGREDSPEVVAVEHRAEFLRIRLTGHREEIGQGATERTSYGGQLLPAVRTRVETMDQPVQRTAGESRERQFADAEAAIAEQRDEHGGQPGLGGTAAR